MEEKEIIVLEIGVTLNDMDEAIASAEDNAWDHAKESAEVLGIEMGDDEFGVIFQELLKRYTHNTEHLQFFMATSLLLTKSLIESGTISIFTEDKLYTEEETAKKISKMANSIVNSYMWIAGGYELTWLSNDEMPEDVKVKFQFDINDILFNEEDNDNDTV